MQKISMQLKDEPFDISCDLLCKMAWDSLLYSTRRTTLELAKRGATSVMFGSEPDNLGKI